MPKETVSTTGFWCRSLLALTVVYLGYTMAGCGSTAFNDTEVVCSAQSAETTYLVGDVVSVEVVNSSGDEVDLADEALTITQTLQEVDNGNLNYELFPDYSYFSKLSFSYSDGGETVAITLMIDPDETYSVSSALPLLVTINGVEQSIESETETVSVHQVSIPYTIQGQARELVVTLDYASSVTINTTYSQAITCQLDCENITTFGLGDGSHKVECNYSCADGTSGNLESGTVHSDSDVDQVALLYAEEEIQALASGCTFSDFTQTSGDDMVASFTVTINE